MEDLCRVLRSHGGDIVGVSNTGVAVSAMAEANLKVIIYYFKHINRIGRTSTHDNVEISKVCVIYHKRYMEEAHNELEVVPTFDPKGCSNNLKTVEELIRGFRRVDGKALSYGLRDDLETPVDASYPTHLTNDSEYFTHDEEIIARGLILSGSVVLGSDPEFVRTFIDLFITDRALIWDKMVTIFQVSY